MIKIAVTISNVFIFTSSTKTRIQPTSTKREANQGKAIETI